MYVYVYVYNIYIYNLVKGCYPQERKKREGMVIMVSFFHFYYKHCVKFTKWWVSRNLVSFSGSFSCVPVSFSLSFFVFLSCVRPNRANVIYHFIILIYFKYTYICIEITLLHTWTITTDKMHWCLSIIFYTIWIILLHENLYFNTHLVQLIFKIGW